MKSPKPIVTVALPSNVNLEELHNIKGRIGNQLTDYHVLVYQSFSSKEVEIKVFYEKDFNEVKYEELKQIIKDSVK